MTRWAALNAVPERLWVDFDENGGWLPVPWQTVVMVVLLAWLFPAALLLDRHGRSGSGGQWLMALGYFLALAIGWVTYLRRQHRRRHLFRTARPGDWTCAKCLHHEPG